MAFPSLVAQNPTGDATDGGAASNGATAATSHQVVLPSTVNPGDQLWIFGRVAAAGTVAITGGGWTITQFEDGSGDVAFAAYKNSLAAGNEDGSGITVTHGNARMVAATMSISGAEHPATVAPTFSTVANANSTSVDPTTCNPGTAKDYMWIWFGSWEGEQTLSKTAPTNYTDGPDISCGTAGSVAANCQMKTARRNLNASSEDAGAVTISTADDWAAWLIAIPPAGPPTLAIANSAQAQTAQAVVLTVPHDPPTITVFESAYDTTTDPKDIVVSNCLAGDWLFILAGGDAGSDVIGATPSTQAGSTGSWTLTHDDTAASFCWHYGAKAQVSADGSVTVRLDLTGTITGNWGFTVFRARGSDGVGDIGALTSASAVETVEMAVGNKRSAVAYRSSDYSSGTVGTGWTPITGATLVERAQVTGYTVHVAYWDDQSAGTRDYGSTGAGGSEITGFAIEIFGKPSLTGTTLVVQNSAQAQSVQAVVLSPHLVIANSAQAQVAQNVTLTFAAVDLVIQNSAQAQVAQNVTLAPTLIVQNSAQAQSTQAVTLVPTLTIQNSQQKQLLGDYLLNGYVVTVGGNPVLVNGYWVYSLTPPDLVIQNSAQSQTAQNVTLSIGGVDLVIQNSAQAQATQAVTLVPDLVIQNSAQAQTAQNVSLTPDLVIQNSAQAQAAQNVSLVPNLVIQNSAQSQVAQNVSLTPTLIVQNSAQSQTATNVTLTAGGVDLTIQNSAQSQAAQSVTLVLTLTVQNSAQAQTTTSPSLSPTLVIQNSAQTQTTTSPSLAPTLIVSNTAQAQVSQNVTLTLPGALVIQNSAQAQTVENVTFLAGPGEFTGWGLALTGYWNPEDSFGDVFQGTF